MLEENKINIALITRSAGEIGYEFAKILTKDNYNIILIGRNEEKLNLLKSRLKDIKCTRITILSKDLSDPKHLYEICSYLNINRTKRKILAILIYNVKKNNI